MAWLGKTLLRARPFTLFQHSDGRAKWKGHTGVHLLERRVGGAVIGGALSLRLRAMAVEPGTRSYGAKLRVRLFPMRGKVIPADHTALVLWR